MPGKTSHVTPLESRKQLLIAQSELNRAGLAEEWQGMAHGVRDFSQRAKNIASWTASAALLVAGVTGATTTDIFATLGNILRNAFVRAYLPRLEDGQESVGGLTFQPPQISDPISAGDSP
jgi:hypothetical protein